MAMPSVPPPAAAGHGAGRRREKETPTRPGKAAGHSDIRVRHDFRIHSGARDIMPALVTVLRVSRPPPPRGRRPRRLTVETETDVIGEVSHCKMMVVNAPMVPALQAENDGLRQSLQALSVKSAALQADIEIMIPLQASMQAENDVLRDKVRTLCDQNDLLHQQRSTLEAGNSQLQEEVRNLKSKVLSILQSSTVPRCTFPKLTACRLMLSTSPKRS